MSSVEKAVDLTENLNKEWQYENVDPVTVPTGMYYWGKYVDTETGENVYVPVWYDPGDSYWWFGPQQTDTPLAVWGPIFEPSWTNANAS